MPKAAANLSLVDDLVARLEKAIFSGEFPPGTRLREARIANSLGVGRGPLREAVRRLEGRKLVVRQANRGTSVAVLTREEVAELFQVREGLEVTACRLAAQHITEQELAKLRATLDRHREVQSNPRAELYGAWHNFDFHFQIAQASRNSRLLDILYGDVWSLLRLYRFPGILSPGRSPTGQEEHEEILRALSKHDVAACDNLMRRHLAHAQESLLRGMSPLVSPRHKHRR